MANLVQIAEELEYMPKDQLAQMTQDPNSTYPQFLVLSEIQRRTQLERAYQAQAEGMGPQTTVAEETVAEFMGSTNKARLQLLASLGIDPTGMSEEEITQQLQQMEGASNKGGLLDFITPKYIGSPYGDVYSPFPSGEGVSELGITQEEINTGVDETESMIRKGLRERYMDDDGTVDWSQTVSDATLAIPGYAGLKVAGKGLQLAKPYLARLGKGLKNKFYAKDVNPIKYGKGKYIDPRTGRTVDQSWKGSTFTKINPNVIKYGAYTGAGGAFLAAQTNQQLEDMREADLSKEKKAEIEAEINRRKVEEENRKKRLDARNKKETTKKSGLFPNISQDQGLTIAQLGGVLMGAKNMSELGTGIAGVAGQAQDRRSSAGLAGAQEAYYEGQVRKIDSEIADMPKEAIREQMSMIIKASEAGLITDIKLANTKYAALEKRLALLEGQETKPASQDANVIASYG